MKMNWLKLDVNILNDSKIKIIRKYPDGDKIIVLWIGLLCLAMKSNECGLIYITTGIPYTIKDLSIEFDIDEKTVELALTLFKQYNMIDFLEGNIIEVINFEKHQSLEKIERVKELANGRVKKYREKNKQQCNADVTLCNADVTLCNADVTQQIRLDKIRLDKNKDIKIGDKSPVDIDYQKKIDLYNSNLKQLKNLEQEQINKAIFKVPKEVKQLSELIKKFDTLEEFESFLEVAKKDKFIKVSFMPSLLNSQYSKLIVNVKSENTGMSTIHDYYINLAEWGEYEQIPEDTRAKYMHIKKKYGL